MSEPRKIVLRIHDAHLSLWQDDPNDESFRTDVFIGLLKRLGQGGWAVGPDAEIVKHYNVLKQYNRRASKGELEAQIQISGRVVKLELWADNYDGGNRNGNRHGYDKRQHMPYLTNLRVELEFRRVVAWARERFAVTLSPEKLRPPQISAADHIAADYADSCHKDKALGRPVASPGNSRSGDGGMIEHGARVWYIGRDRRIRRGHAFTHINNMWWVIEAKDAVRNLSSHEIFVSQPAELRRKRNERDRRSRLEAELARATRLMDFERAATLRRILFGKEAPLLIWSNKNNAYYRSCFAGYTTDPIESGKYEEAEALREVARVSHILVAKTLDGRDYQPAGEVAA